MELDDVTIEPLDFACGSLCQFVADIIYYLPISSWRTLSVRLFELSYLPFYETSPILKLGLLHLLCKIFPSFFCGSFLVVPLFWIAYVGNKHQSCIQNSGELLITFYALSATISTIPLCIVS